MSRDFCSYAGQIDKIYNQGCLISKPNIKPHDYWLHVKDPQAVNHAWKHKINGGFRKGKAQSITSSTALSFLSPRWRKHVARLLYLWNQAVC